MARHNVSLPADLSARVKRRAEADGGFHLSWWVQAALTAELDRWERENPEQLRWHEERAASHAMTAVS